jgi:uroporphyrinogen decarboxylase
VRGFRDTTLIGFAGSPWTVACYMVEGEGSKEFGKAQLMALREPEKFSVLIDILVRKTSEYLLRQVEAGAEAIQLFDTWAGLLSPVQFEKWVIEPTCQIVSCLREKYPALPIIGFPRGAGFLYPDYAAKTGITALGLDQQLPLSVAKELQKTIPVQGNLDPFVLLCGGRELDQAIDGILESLGNQSGFVFNLGHGIHKDTPPQNVARLVARVRG